MKYRWNRFFRETLPMFIVWHLLPARVVLWAYIRVMSLSGNGPCSCFKESHDLWCDRFGLKP